MNNETRNKNAIIYRIATILGVFFLLIITPIVYDTTYKNNISRYINTYPSNNLLSIKITYSIYTINKVGNIGSDIYFKHYINNTLFYNNDIVSIPADKGFTIKSKVIEEDDIDDVGVGISAIQVFAEDNYREPLIVVQNVHVEEEGGRINVGSYADFRITYKLERVVPESLSYWDLLFYKYNGTSHFKNIALVFLPVISVASSITIILFRRKKRKMQIEAERIKKEQQFLADRDSFIKSLNGNSIRQAAGVPLNVSFAFGLPKDNNDTIYGSYTVYCSRNGKCYHEKAGCCSARYPEHYFNVIGHLRPCVKCCKKQKEIPQWYKEYCSMKSKATYYKVDIDE